VGNRPALSFWGQSAHSQLKILAGKRGVSGFQLVRKRLAFPIRCKTFMKNALLKMLSFFVGREQGEKNHPVGRSYCVCGALKPEVGGKERESSLKMHGRSQVRY
jgi:hypothetical protein